MVKNMMADDMRPRLRLIVDLFKPIVCLFQQVAGKTMKEVSRAAISNLDEMWLVGVIEQYEGFMTVLRVMMDPQKR